MDLRICTEPQQGASDDTLLAAARGEAGAERVYLQVLDLADLDHIAMAGADVLPRV